MEQVTLSRKQLYDLVWSESLLSLSKKYSISDVGLRKICNRMNIPVPKKGFWQKVKSGKSVSTMKLPQDFRVKNEVILKIRTMRYENDNLAFKAFKDKVQEIENDPTLPLKVAERLTNPSDLIVKVRDKLLYRDKYHSFYKHGSNITQQGYLSIEVSQANITRALRIFDAIIKLFRARGHKIVVEHFDTLIIIGEEEFKVSLKEKQSFTKNEKTGNRESSFSGKLVFRHMNYSPKGWSDDKQPVEDQLSKILAYFEIEAEKSRIQRIKWEEESRKRDERERILREERERQERDLARFNDLIKQANKWHQATIISDYINAIESNAVQKHIMTDELVQWLEWARRKVADFNPLNGSDK